MLCARMQTHWPIPKPASRLMDQKTNPSQFMAAQANYKSN